MTPELHRPVQVSALSPSGEQRQIEATEKERAALAARMGLPAIPALSCDFTLRRGLGGAVEAEGVLRARVVQVCVISLDEFESEVVERFVVRFVPEGTESDEIDPDEDVDEIPYAGGVIDLGEAAAEQLGLALDPYPRKPGATLPESAAGEPGNPFASLARPKARH